MKSTNEGVSLTTPTVATASAPEVTTDHQIGKQGIATETNILPSFDPCQEPRHRTPRPKFTPPLSPFPASSATSPTNFSYKPQPTLHEIQTITIYITKPPPQTTTPHHGLSHERRRASHGQRRLQPIRRPVHRRAGNGRRRRRIRRRQRDG